MKEERKEERKEGSAFNMGMHPLLGENKKTSKD